MAKAKKITKAAAQVANAFETMMQPEQMLGLPIEAEGDSESEEETPKAHKRFREPKIRYTRETFTKHVNRKR